MNRLLALLASFGLAGVIFVGCTPAAVDDGDDDDNDNNCNGGCAIGRQCVSGECVCTNGLLECGTVCTNPVSDPYNCGQCGVACPPTAPFCAGNLGCQATCPGLTCPGNVCVNPASDATNCGTCGNVCSNGTQCNNGACSCPAGTQPCGASCAPIGQCNQGTGGTSGVGGTPALGGTAGALQGGVGGTPPAGGAAGAPQGGVGQGGAAGGVSGSGPTGGVGGMITGNPPGWWTHASWHGCPWTGIDTVAGTTTLNMPRDFLTHMDGTGYCVSGEVFSSYDAVALLGFNLNETPNGMANQCAYNPAAAMQMGPPGVTLTGTGIAINFTKSVGSVLRIQVQGPNGATDPNNRWCATITAATGPVFVPYTAFNTECWEGGMGTAFNPANSPISAVAFLVPGTMGATTDFGYCINGFATGSSAADAPTWGTGGGGNQMGTIGGPGGENLDYQRVKIAVGGKSYIIQNNNWGNPGGSDQLLTYVNNSFTVTSSNGTGNMAPASFPSIFIGANGDVQGGTFSTRENDGLPKQISAIGTAMSTFRHTGTSGALNATYDIWFSDVVPNTQEYDDALDGFVMLWLYDPPNQQPIGSVVRSNVTIGGRAWNVWVGPRNAGGNCQGTTCSSSRPVVSYVATQTSTSFSGDLKPFFTDAAQHGIPANWYLTDVFAGFECWSGSDCVGKKVEEFTAVIQ